MGDAEEGRSRGSALEKALLVLDAITEQPQAIGLPDIAARIALPRQTAHRILQQLERTQLVARDPIRDRFSIGPRLSRLALSALFSENYSAPVRTVLRRLVEEVQETCNLGALKGMEFVHFERVEFPQPLRILAGEGGRVPAHCSAGGKAQLAFMPSEVRARMLRSAELRRATDRTVTDPGALEEEFNTIRQRGFAICYEELAAGIAAVGVPIFDRAGRPLAALALHGPIARLPEDKLFELAPRLKQSVREISAIWDIADESV